MGIMVYSLLRVMQDLHIINRRMGFEGIFYSKSYIKEPQNPILIATAPTLLVQTLNKTLNRICPRRSRCNTPSLNNYLYFLRGYVLKL